MINQKKCGLARLEKKPTVIQSFNIKENLGETSLETHIRDIKMCQ